MKGAYRLKGNVKHYDWGGFSFIPSLLKMDNPEQKPCAEYWLGVHAHDNCCIEIGNNQFELLKEFLENNPSLLGDKVQHEFGHLPYLLKVLDVQKMLSIQVHPTKEAAAVAFANENALGIPLDAANRNYKDANHKPELMVALSDFWLLHGFKPPEEMADILMNVTELRELLPFFLQSGYEGLYKHVMEMPQAEVNRILAPLIRNLTEIYKTELPDKYVEDYWVLKAIEQFPHHGNIDRGVFSIYFFNLVHLEKGEGIFQNAGVPHAYLQGQNVEVMASSDNVLRGGLTNKHIDVSELLKHVTCEPTYVEILEGVGNLEKVYATNTPDFRLSVFELNENDEAHFSPVTAEIVVLTEGAIHLQTGNNHLQLSKGEPAAILFPGNEVKLIAASNALLFRATVPFNIGV